MQIPVHGDQINHRNRNGINQVAQTQLLMWMLPMPMLVQAPLCGHQQLAPIQVWFYIGNYTCIVTLSTGWTKAKWIILTFFSVLLRLSTSSWTNSKCQQSSRPTTTATTGSSTAVTTSASCRQVCSIILFRVKINNYWIVALNDHSCYHLSSNNNVVGASGTNNPGGNSTASGLIGGGTSTAAAKNQLEQLTTMRDALFSQGNTIFLKNKN